MTKSGRRALFLFVATAANLLLTILILVVLVIAWSLVAHWLNISAASVLPATIAAFIAAVALAGLAYHKYLKFLQGRPDLAERYGLLK